MSRFLAVLLTTVCLAAQLTDPARAGNAGAFLSGRVEEGGHPVAGATVTAVGNESSHRTTTSGNGRFQFPPLALGAYAVSAVLGKARGEARVDLAMGGVSIVITISRLKQIVVVSVGSASTVHGSGSDVVLSSKSLTEMPYYNSPNAFSAMETQLPGAAQGANGVVHMNGDHGVIDYQIDGVMLPQQLNRDLGGEIPLADLSYVDLIEGAYPAQYGLRFGSVFNLETRAGTGPAGLDGNISYGSYGTLNSTLAYHAPLEGGGGYDVALGGMQTDRALDPPEFNSSHDDGTSVNQFARFTLPGGSDNDTGVTFIHSIATFEIPNDVQFGEPAATDDSEDQEDTFVALQFHHAIGESGAWDFGPAFKSSNIEDFGDPRGDWAYGESLNVAPPPFGNGGTRTDCANATSNPGGFLPTTCGFSLNDNRTAFDYIMQGDYTRSYGNHAFQAGATYDGTLVDKYYAIALQPGNFLAPVLTPSTPNAPATVVDDAPNSGNTYSAYLQDSWRIDPRWEADYGLRYDFFNIASTAFPEEGFGAFSPRFKLTRFFGNRASFYAYIGRFFEPFSFENVSPAAAEELNLPLQRSVAAFDLLPERDTDLELGGHVPVGRGDLGFRVWQKNANDLIDDTQVGVTLLHQDINYLLGRLSQEAINYTERLGAGGRAYFAFAHTISVNSGCETQLLAPCFGQPAGYTPADHEQRWTINGGVLYPDQRGGWLSADAYYGSGLASAYCEPANLLCHETPHTIFDLEKGVAVNRRTAVYVDIQNLLNDRYYVTLLNAQGNHYAAPRTFSVGVRFQP